MSAELDKQCAAALGWKQTRLPNIGFVWEKPNGGLSMQGPTPQMLEDEIERRGLQAEYLKQLIGIIINDPAPASDVIHLMSWLDFWDLIRATPEQRAQAFLEAVRGNENP